MNTGITSIPVHLICPSK